MRNLNPEDIDQLITVGGMVIRTSSLIPEMREGDAICVWVCGGWGVITVIIGPIELKLWPFKDASFNARSPSFLILESSL